MRPEWKPIFIVGENLLAIWIDQPLSLEMLSGVLGHLLVLLEPIAGPQLEELEVLRTDQHTVVGSVSEYGLRLPLDEELEGQLIARDRDEALVTLLILLSIVEPGAPSMIVGLVQPLNHLEKTLVPEKAFPYVLSAPHFDFAGETLEHHGGHLCVGIVGGLHPAEQPITVDVIVGVNHESRRVTELSRPHLGFDKFLWKYT